MKRRSLFITEPQLKNLERLSRKNGLAVAELIRRAIDHNYATKKCAR
jgi:hypothetical protein